MDESVCGGYNQGLSGNDFGDSAMSADGTHPGLLDHRLGGAARVPISENKFQAADGTDANL